MASIITKNKLKVAISQKSERLFKTFFESSDLNIEEYTDLIGDKKKFLEIYLTNPMTGRTIQMEPFIKTNLNTFPKEEEIKKFFFGDVFVFKFDTFSELHRLIEEVNTSKQDVSILNNYKKELRKGLCSRTDVSSPFIMLFNHYRRQFKTILGETEAKWYIEDLSENSLSGNQLRLTGGNVNLLILHAIVNLANPDSPHLNNEVYIEFFEVLLSTFLYALGSNIMNFTPVVKGVVRLINDKIGYTYIVLNCKNKLGSYTCGRAISSIGRTSTEKMPRLVVFNTESGDSDNLDYEYYKILVPEDAELNLEQGGDKHFYKTKYLKYKQKYLELKNRIK
jgi:hypothetical protein